MWSSRSGAAKASMDGCRKHVRDSPGLSAKGADARGAPAGQITRMMIGRKMSSAENMPLSSGRLRERKERSSGFDDDQLIQFLIACCWVEHSANLSRHRRSRICGGSDLLEGQAATPARSSKSRIIAKEPAEHPADQGPTDQEGRPLRVRRFRSASELSDEAGVQRHPICHVAAHHRGVRVRSRFNGYARAA
jgi:hypothetical protein